MEERIGLLIQQLYWELIASLNPYCNGRKNRIGHQDTANLLGVEVLILIVMEERIGFAVTPIDKNDFDVLS